MSKLRNTCVRCGYHEIDLDNFNADGLCEECINTWTSHMKERSPIKIDLIKESKLTSDEATITVKITVNRYKDYQGFDIFPDELIPDLILAASRKIRIKKGKLK